MKYASTSQLAFNRNLPHLPCFLCVFVSQLACGRFVPLCFISFIWLVVAVCLICFDSFFVSSSNTELHKSNERLISYIKISKFIMASPTSLGTASALQMHLHPKQLVLDVACTDVSNVTYNYVNTIWVQDQAFLS